MNPETSSSNSSGQPGQNLRKERGGIAAQACDTCRSRKQRCDEQRPKCGLCQRMKLECNYREPQPTKKDKTLVEILNRLASIENKVDRIPKNSPSSTGFGVAQPSPASQASNVPEVEPHIHSASSSRPSQLPSPRNTGQSQPYRHASAAHKMLSWPAIQDLLYKTQSANTGDIRSLEAEGSAFIVRMQKGTPILPLDEFLDEQPFLGMQSSATRTTGGPRVTFPDLTPHVMQRLADAYFDSFNFLYPFMDRQNFLSDTVIKVSTEGFNGDTDSVIALLVFALGELAIEGSHGTPINYYKGRPSGIRGGTTDRPPGLALFNEARKRLGFVMTECDLESVQIFSLAALYYEQCSRHVDFWRLTVSASLACQVLITCNPIDWGSQKGDLVRRVYWHCAIMETGLHLELDLPLTGIVGLEDIVGQPTFNAPFCEADEMGDQSSHFRDHFRSQIDLRRICANLHNNINESFTVSDTPATSTDDLGGPSSPTLKLLASQLDEWRSSLPLALQWPEDNPTVFPTPSPAQATRPYNQPLDPSLSGRPLFSANLDEVVAPMSQVYDIQVALLRTRYYYAKYMIHRPFIYKVLHFPEQVTKDDAEGAANCLKSCIRWPITLSPPSRRKRLIPYLFCWSQNFLGILLILHLSRQNEMLLRVRRELLGPRFDAEANESVLLMLDWIRDLKSSDPIPSWCYEILRNIYPTDA